MMLSIWLLSIILSSSGQSCNPAVVDYIVRDETGNVISEADLKTLAAQLPNPVGDANVATAQVSFAPDKQKYFWPESVDWKEGEKVGALEFANAATCTLHLTEITLTFHNHRMRLIFNIDIARVQDDRRPVVDSVNFQEGTFELNLTGWSKASDQVIPASRWKKRG